MERGKIKGQFAYYSVVKMAKLFFLMKKTISGCRNDKSMI